MYNSDELMRELLNRLLTRKQWRRPVGVRHDPVGFILRRLVANWLPISEGAGWTVPSIGF